MILAAILVVVFGLMSAVLALIPSFEVLEMSLFTIDGTGWSATAYDVSSGIGSWLVAWDLFVPVEVFFVCMFALIATKLFIGVVKLVLFVWEKLPFKAT